MKRKLEDFILKAWLRKGLISTILLPLAWLYGALAKYHRHKQLKNSWHAPVPVVVVGNIIVGGTGKTPVTIALCQELIKLGWRPGIVSRGYGAEIGPYPHLSSIRTDSKYLGDEPSLLHLETGLQVAVHPQRVLAAKAILRTDPKIDIIIADDGLQHLSLARDVEIIVQDQRGSGNGRLIPAGPLRESQQRLKTADFVINNTTDSNEIPKTINSKSIYMSMQGSFVTHLASGSKYELQDWLEQFNANGINAIAGIGQPNRFFDMLKSQSANLKNCIAIPDHQAISALDLEKLREIPILITTKDAVKLDKHCDDRIWVVHAKPVFSDPEWINRLSNQLLKPN